MSTSSIYFVVCPTLNSVKIGIATNVRERLVDLQVGCSERLELVATVPGGRAEEVALHEAFAAHRIRGEWFEYTTPIRQFISRLATPAGSRQHLYSATELKAEFGDGYYSMFRAMKALTGCKASPNKRGCLFFDSVEVMFCREIMEIQRENWASFCRDYPEVSLSEFNSPNPKAETISRHCKWVMANKPDETWHDTFEEAVDRIIKRERKSWHIQPNKKPTDGSINRQWARRS